MVGYHGLSVRSRSQRQSAAVLNASQLGTLVAVRSRTLKPSTRLAELTAQLKLVNEELWRIEDDIRLQERNQDFGTCFIELARSVYQRNDERAAIKKKINQLLGSRIVEEKCYGEPSQRDESVRRPPPVTTVRRATVCILTYGNYPEFFQRCLLSVVKHTPAAEIELRLGFNDAPKSFQFALGRLKKDWRAPHVEMLESGIELVTFPSESDLTVRMWNSPTNLYKEPMSRHMYYDVPIETEYVIWLDDDSYVEAGWWPELRKLFDRQIHYIGQRWWVQYLPGQTEMIKSMPWYRGVAFEERDGKQGAHFMTGGFMAVQMERLREVNFPDVDFTWKGDTLKQYGGDTLLGEIARQLGWSQAIHDKGIKVNVDLNDTHPAPRRGGTGRQFGSDIDVVIK